MNISQAHAFVDTLGLLNDGYLKPIKFGFKLEKEIDQKEICEISHKCLQLFKSMYPLSEREQNINKLVLALENYSSKTKSEKIFESVIQDARNSITQNLKSPHSLIMSSAISEKDEKHSNEKSPLTNPPLASNLEPAVNDSCIENLKFPASTKEFEKLAKLIKKNNESTLKPAKSDSFFDDWEFMEKASIRTLKLWKIIATQYVDMDNILLCSTEKEIINLIQEKIASTLREVCYRFPEGPELLNKISELPAFEQAKQIEYWIQKKSYSEDLKSLNLSSCNLDFIPAAIFELKNLKELDLSSNNLKTLPPGIGNFKNLKQLNVSYNNLKEIPSEFGELINLRELNLNHNNLEDFPIEMNKLIGIKKLEISFNGLNKTPEFITKLKDLVYLDLSGNLIQELPKEIGNLENLILLNLNYNLLKTLPHEIYKFRKLRCLCLNENQINELSSSISNLQELKTLHLLKNKLEKLPEELLLLSSLEVLDLGVMNPLKGKRYVEIINSLRDRSVGVYFFKVFDESILPYFVKNNMIFEMSMNLNQAYAFIDTLGHLPNNGYLAPSGSGFELKFPSKGNFSEIRNIALDCFTLLRCYSKNVQWDLKKYITVLKEYTAKVGFEPFIPMIFGAQFRLNQLQDPNFTFENHVGLPDSRGTSRRRCLVHLITDNLYSEDKPVYAAMFDEKRESQNDVKLDKPIAVQRSDAKAGHQD